MRNKQIKKKILIEAENLIQTKGYNAFSYRDIAEKIGIKTSSIHYYFPTKVDLVAEVVRENIASLGELLEDTLSDPAIRYREKLEKFFDGVFETTYLSDRKMCLGGMLASEVLTLSEEIQYEVRLFFQKIENWLARLLTQGIEKQEFNVIADVTLESILILSMLEGALLMARLYQDEKRLMYAKKAILLRLSIT